MILLIPEINIFNYPLCLLLSFRNTVKAYRTHRFLHIFKTRVKLLDLSDYFDWAECGAIGSRAVDIWESILPGFPSPGWELKIKDDRGNLSLKAKQELQHEIEKLLFLKRIVSLHKGRNEDVRIINSLKLDFLSGLGRRHDLFCFPTLKTLSKIFIFLDRINLAAENLLRFGACICRFIYAFFRNENPKRTVRYLCAGIVPTELADGIKIYKDDIIFLLPGHDMLKLASRKKIINCFPVLLWFFIKCALPLRWNLQDLLVTKYAIRIIQWIPVIESLNPKIYIDSISSVGFEDPGIIYFKEVKGIKTVLWSYGTNSYLFYKNKRLDRLRRVLLSYIISSDFIVWNEHYKEYIEEHPQGEIHTHPIGPLMCGDEDVMHTDRNILFEKIGLVHVRAFKYVAIFDSPPLSSRNRGFSAWYPRLNSEEYNYEFMRDMYRLLSDFQNIRLIYKPKRSLNTEKFSYSSELKELLRQIAKNRKVVILDYNINPWVPIAMADICISMPFASPPIAAIHYEKMGLFHDALNIVLSHRYEDFQELITHSYEELKSKMTQYLYGKRQIRDILDENRLRKIQGRFPKENSSNRFREYLASL